LGFSGGNAFGVMSFSFHKSEPLGRAACRVARSRIHAARAHLRRGKHPGAIHGARKEIKKVRALLRLLRSEINPRVYRKIVKSLRDAAGRLAASRDARVMQKAFEHLAGRGKEKFPAIALALEKHVRSEARRFEKKNSIAKAKRALRKAARRLATLKIKSAGWAAIEPGLKMIYRRGRTSYQQTCAASTPEHLHAWRKHVKDLWYICCLLHPMLPPTSQRCVDDLEHLGELLGEDHDLFLLDVFLVERFSDNDDVAKTLGKLIELRRRKLQRSAMKLGAEIYTETPVAFCRRFERHWCE
jgi:CHAD domain-containing protein